MTVTINIHPIRENKGEELSGKLSLVSEQLALNPEQDCCWHKIRFQYTVVNADKFFLLSGRLQGDFTQPCSRCLKPVTTSVDTKVVEKFGRQNLLQADEDMLAVDGDELDITFILRDYLLLELPLKVVCSENCRGLCPQCGKDLNHGDCQCVVREVDPRLAVLQKLLDQNNK